MSTHFSTKTAEITQVFSKTDRRYWKDRVYLLKRVTRDLEYEDKDYSVQIQFNGKRHRFPLGTPNKAAAQEQAAQIYRAIISTGWENALALFGGAKHQIQKELERKGSTLAALIEAYKKASPARTSSQDTYVKAIRNIYAEINKIDCNKKYKSTGNQKGMWRKRVEDLLISSVTPEAVATWRRACSAKAKTESETKSITTTINSKIRNAKALFSKRVLVQIAREVQLPPMLPFEGVRLDNCTLPKYESRMDSTKILAEANSKLKNTDHATYCAFLLAIYCGLRRAEIDNLLWSSVDLVSGVIHVEGNDYYRLKSPCSSGSIDLGDEIVQELTALRKKNKGDFVIPSEREPKRHMNSTWYRCDATFCKLIEWLRSNGVRSKKPIHELRKEVGSIVARDFGIFEASRFLRHGDISVTAGIYLDKKQKVVPKFTC